MISRGGCGQSGAGRPRGGCGFTVVELLVVIAIISVLISFLLPTLRRGMEQARTVSCCGNLRQVHLALNCYMNDFSGYVPNGKKFYIVYFLQNNKVTGMDYVPYQTFYCPSAKFSDPWQHGPAGISRGHYGFNYCWLYGSSENPDSSIAKPDFNRMNLLVRNPSKVISVGDIMLSYVDLRPRLVDWRHDGGTQWDGSTWPWPSEFKGGANFAFVDGHAKTYRFHDGPVSTWSEYSFLLPWRDADR